MLSVKPRRCGEGDASIMSKYTYERQMFEIRSTRQPSPSLLIYIVFKNTTQFHRYLHERKCCQISGTTENGKTTTRFERFIKQTCYIFRRLAMYFVNFVCVKRCSLQNRRTIWLYVSHKPFSQLFMNTESSPTIENRMKYILWTVQCTRASV